jgi:phosphatidylserine/phosphatidylglycerophosphate/cardiolipin synthase-like enzyme
MLVDPLGPDPVVVTGSGNFSRASCLSNDENFLIFRGEHAVSDAYFCEFMRLWRHFRSRSHKGERRGGGKLDPSAAWTLPFFDPADVRALQRESVAALHRAEEAGAGNAADRRAAEEEDWVFAPAADAPPGRLA